MDLAAGVAAALAAAGEAFGPAPAARAGAALGRAVHRARRRRRRGVTPPTSSSSTRATCCTTARAAPWRSRRSDLETRLLAGDCFYARGLRGIAARGDADAVGLLARLMAACSYLRSAGAPFSADDALWAYTTAGLVAQHAGAATGVRERALRRRRGGVPRRRPPTCRPRSAARRPASSCPTPRRCCASSTTSPGGDRGPACLHQSAGTRGRAGPRASGGGPVPRDGRDRRPRQQGARAGGPVRAAEATGRAARRAGPHEPARLVSPARAGAGRAARRHRQAHRRPARAAGAERPRRQGQGARPAQGARLLRAQVRQEGRASARSSSTRRT